MKVVNDLFADRQQRLGIFLAMPSAGYLLIFFVMPTVVLFAYSFWSAQAFVLKPDYSIKNYADIFTSGIFWRALWAGSKIGLCTAFFSTLLSFPVACHIAFHARSNIILYLVLVSWFSSYLVKMYAWKSILGSSGLINSSLMAAGVIDRPMEFFIFSPLAVVITLTHIFLPFTLLLLLGAMRGIRPDYIEAARDLGAPRGKILSRVIIPMSYKGIMGSLMFTFILASADFITPQLLGGRSSVTAGLMIANQFRVTGNWPYGAAMSFILFIFFILAYYIFVKTFQILRIAPGRRYHH